MAHETKAGDHEADLQSPLDVKASVGKLLKEEHGKPPFLFDIFEPETIVDLEDKVPLAGSELKQEKVKEDVGVLEDESTKRIQDDAIFLQEGDLFARLVERPLEDSPPKEIVIDATPNDLDLVSIDAPLNLSDSTSIAHFDDEAEETVSLDYGLSPSDEGFFTGWDGIEIDDAIDKDDPIKSELSNYLNLSIIEIEPESLSLQNIYAEPETENFASYNEVEDDLDDVRLKHDALAEAVHSALMSVYGSDHDGSDDHKPHRMIEKEPLHTIASQDSELQDDGLSPQDVILNYFSYGNDSLEYASDDDDSQDAEEYHNPAHHNSIRNAEFVSQRKSVQPSVQKSYSQFPAVQVSQERVAAQYQALERYEGAPSYPVPAMLPPEMARRSRRHMWGAAGLGMVGGIAIAASLTVFYLNSHDFPADPQTTLSSDASSSQKETAQLQQPAEPEKPASDIVVADVSGSAGKPIGLAVSLKGQKLSDQTLVSITGIPSGARLNGGVDAGSGNWLVTPRRLNGLALTPSSEMKETIPLEVQLVDSTANTPLTDKKKFSIQLVSHTEEIPLPADVSNNASSTALVGSTDRATSAELAFAKTATLPNFGNSAFNTQTLPVTAAQIAPSALVVTPQAQRDTALGFNTQAVPSPSSYAPPIPVAPPAAQTASLTPSPMPSRTKLDTSQNASLNQPEIEDLIREGNRRMRDGNIIEARDYYQKAILLGNPEAALAMGRSYDPIYFERLATKNADPDAAKAFEWYKQAMDNGVSQAAKIRIENLKQFMNR